MFSKSGFVIVGVNRAGRRQQVGDRTYPTRLEAEGGLVETQLDHNRTQSYYRHVHSVRVVSAWRYRRSLGADVGVRRLRIWGPSIVMIAAAAVFVAVVSQPWIWLVFVVPAMALGFAAGGSFNRLRVDRTTIARCRARAPRTLRPKVLAVSVPAALPAIRQTSRYADTAAESGIR